jgi:hypothetical protein
MRFPRYWAKAGDAKLGVSAWGWSDEGQAFAEAEARARLARIAARVASGDFAALGRYGYGERALREPVLEELAGAAITRNSYGCDVLNTERVMFIDIDLPEAASPGALGRLFGQKRTDPEGEALARVEGWLARNADWGFRAYRTKAGLRLLATQSTIDPAQGEATMSALGADPLYLRLCRSQKSYRARLTPKPWRCGARSPGWDAQWPFADREAERRFDAWQRTYRDKASRYASCRFIRTLGNSKVESAVAPLVALHDERTRAAADLPLA